MSIELVHDIWMVLRDHIDSHDRTDAADGLVNLLIDNDFSAADIKTTFRGDRDVISALKFYAEEHDDPEEDEYKEEDDDGEEW